MSVKVSAASNYGGGATLQSHASTHDENYTLLGRLNAAWATLDYVMRLALKRKRGVGINSPEADNIFGSRSHAEVIGFLLAEYAGEQAVLDELRKIGKSKDGPEYYGRRNKYIHALWAQDDKGQSVFQRIGAHDWRSPIDFEADEINALIADIERTAFDIESLTKV